MALTKKTATKHNLKRAETFKAAGISDWDVKYAHPKFLGKDSSPEGGTCTLCGQQHLMWLYQIRFDAPDIAVALGAITKGISRTAEVVFDPVGSVCITDWFDALPESAEKLAALQRWKVELEKERQAKTIQAIENAIARAGLVDEATAITRFQALDSTQKNALNWFERRALLDLGRRIQLTHLSFRKRWRSVKAVALFGQVLVKAEAIGVPPMVVIDEIVGDEDDADYGQHGDPENGDAHPVEPNGFPLPDTQLGALFPPSPEVAATAAKAAAAKVEVAALLERGRDAFRYPEKLAKLNTFEQKALRDMGIKVKSYGSFASDRQKGYFTRLVEKTEGLVSAEAPKADGASGAEKESAVVSAVKSGDVGFASACKLAGARY